MDKKQKQILQVRNRVMQDRKVLCTGNPNRKGTIASGVREVWPNATFIHLSNGYDFWNLSEKEHEIQKYMVESDKIPLQIKIIKDFKAKDKAIPGYAASLAKSANSKASSVDVGLKKEKEEGKSIQEDFEDEDMFEEGLDE